MIIARNVVSTWIEADWSDDMAKRCKNYVGSACVDGTCPIANYNYYMDRGMLYFAEQYSDVKKCSQCSYYRGCEDCAFDGTEYCDKSRKDVKN